MLERNTSAPHKSERGKISCTKNRQRGTNWEKDAMSGTRKAQAPARLRITQCQRSKPTVAFCFVTSFLLGAVFRAIVSRHQKMRMDVGEPKHNKRC